MKSRLVLACAWVFASVLLTASFAGAQALCFNPAVNYAVGDNPFSVSAADLDGDGDTDLAVANSSDDNVSVLKNNGNGIFASAVNYAVGRIPNSVFAADLDGDDDVDLAVANGLSDSVSVLRNSGDGTFSPKVNYAAGNEPYSVFAKDLDADNDIDLAVANFSSGNISILTNNGDGTFGGPVNYTTGIEASSVFAADLDGDDDPDLAVANYGNTVSVLKNNGNGIFAAAANYTAGIGPHAVCAADLDGDDDLDLAVANEVSDNVSVLKNNGDGTFAAAVNYAAGNGPWSVCAADLDGDGDLDLAAGNIFSDNVSVLRNDGNGIFAAPVNYPAGSWSTPVVAADLDWDGDIDLAVTNYFSNNVSVLINCRPHVRGLIGHWAMNEPSGATVTDSSGNDLDGTASGTTIVTGVRGKARQFNGTSDYVSVSHDPLLSIGDSITIAMWIKPDGDFVEGYPISKRVNGGGVNYCVRVLCRTGTDTVAFHYGEFAERICAAPAQLDNGRWHHIAFTLAFATAASAKWVVDGVPAATSASGPAGAIPWPNTADLQIGRQLDPIPAHFKGNIDEVRLYHQSLTVEAIQALYESTRWDHVTSLADDGPGTLSNALQVASLSPGPDTVAFSVAGTMVLSSPLPPLGDFTGGTAIRGFTAPGASVPDQPTVIIDGTAAGLVAGFEVTSPGNLIEGLEIRNWLSGIILTTTQARCTIRQNRIYRNSRIGIDLGGTGVTLNDPGDADAGPNGLLNFPEIDTVRLVEGDSIFHVAGTSARKSVVELYLAERYLGKDTLADTSGYGGGWLLLGSDTADDVTGHWAFPALHSRAWSYVTATATDTLGNTSEFSSNRRLIPDSLIITGHSPIAITVISPNGQDSVGPTFNTFGSNASYNDTQDWGPGPDGIPGTPDDRVTILNIEPGEYLIKIVTDPGGTGDYFLGIRCDGTEVKWAHTDATGQDTTNQYGSEPYANPVPAPGVEVVVGTTPTPPRRGDLVADGVFNIQDVVEEINHAFRSKPLPHPGLLADINCDGFACNIQDVVALVNTVFRGGAEPCP